MQLQAQILQVSEWPGGEAGVFTAGDLKARDLCAGFDMPERGEPIGRLGVEEWCDLGVAPAWERVGVAILYANS